VAVQLFSQFRLRPGIALGPVLGVEQGRQFVGIGIVNLPGQVGVGMRAIP